MDADRRLTIAHSNLLVEKEAKMKLPERENMVTMASVFMEAELR